MFHNPNHKCFHFLFRGSNNARSGEGKRFQFVLYASCIPHSYGFCLVICLNHVSFVGPFFSKTSKILSLKGRRFSFQTILTTKYLGFYLKIVSFGYLGGVGGWGRQNIFHEGEKKKQNIPILSTFLTSGTPARQRSFRQQIGWVCKHWP